MAFILPDLRDPWSANNPPGMAAAYLMTPVTVVQVTWWKSGRDT